ncbi:hypothetical protein D9M71_278540 [compost metagenome]
MEDFIDIDQREGERLVAQHDHQRRHDRQRQRHLDDDLRALALGRENVDRAVELGNLGLDHVHAHATPRHIGNLGLGREARGENQVVAVRFAQALGRILVHQALFHGLGAQHARVHALAIVGDRQENMVTLLLRRQHHAPTAHLARGFALLWRLDTVVDRVAHQVHQRVGQSLDKVLVQVGLFADQLQIDFFFQLASEVAYQARKAPEDFLDRLHAGFHDRGLQVGGDHIEVRHCLGHGFIATVETQPHQTVTHQHQLADHVHDFVQPRGIDPHSGFRFAGHRPVGNRRNRARSCLGGRDRFACTGLGSLNQCRPGSRRGRGCCRHLELALAVQLIEQGFELVLADVIVAHGADRRFTNDNRRCRDRIDAERTLAMQLIEQGLEFVVSDFIARFTAVCHYGLDNGFDADRIGGKLPFAMQLIEQRLEFGIGDFIADRCLGQLGLSLGLDSIERVGQLFEFVVGDVAVAGCGHRLHGNSRRGQQLLGRRGFSQARQRFEQVRRGRRDRGTLAHLREHAVDRIQCLEHHVHEFGVNPTLTLAQDVEDVLGNVAALHQLVELEEAGAPFYSVKTAKNCIEQIRIIRTAFQLDQLLGQLLKNFAGFYQKILKDFFIGAEAHLGAPLGRVDGLMTA